MACWNILWQLHHHVFSDCLLSRIGGPRGARSHRGLIPIKLWNDEIYSNPHYNSLLLMSVHARDTRYTHNKEFVSYLHTVAETCSLLYIYTCTVSDVQTSLYNIHYSAVDYGGRTRALLQDMFDIHNSKPCGT